MQQKLIFNLVIFVGISLLFSACKKDKVEVPEPHDYFVGSIANGTMISTSIAGFIMDENGTPIEGATVTVGNQSVTTNSLGAFFFDAVNVSENRAFIRAEKPGYFDGSRAIIPVSNGLCYTRIALISKSLTSSFSNSAGGTVSFSGVVLEFEAGDVALENGQPYSGTVHVYTSYLSPSADNLMDIMPGDLMALDHNGDLVALETYGMMAVELLGSNGQPLNVAPGETVTFTMPINGQQSSVAPPTIPMWYFSDTHGNWLEEGVAERNGNTYEGQVSHFTFWNLDFPYTSTIMLTLELECNGIPVPNIPVQLISNVTGLPLTMASTDANGYFQQPIPANMDLSLEIIDPCGVNSFTQNLGMNSTDIDLGVLSICTAIDLYPFTGSIVDCNGQPVVNGAVHVISSGYSNTYFADANGNLNIMVPACNGAAIDFQAFDFANTTISDIYTATVGTQNNAILLTTCNQADNYTSYTINGYSFTVFGTPGGQVTQAINYMGTDTLHMYATASTSMPVNSFHFEFVANSAGTYPNSAGTIGVNDSIGIYGSFNNAGFSAPANSITINLTNYAATVGDHYEGTFGGSFVSFGQPITVNGYFRHKRQ